MNLVTFAVGALLGGGMAVAASQSTSVAVLVLFPTFALVAVAYVLVDSRRRSRS